MAESGYAHLSEPGKKPPGFQSSGRLIFGALLLTVGILWTLDNLNLLESDYILKWWPVAIVVFGLSKLFGWGTNPSRMTGGFFTLIGLVILGAEVDLYDIHIWRLWWPMLLMFVGVSILLRAVRGPRSGHKIGDSDSASADSVMRTFAMMGGTKVRITSNAFQGGEASAFMAGVDVDFRGATPAGDTVVLDVMAMWGGIEITVPPDWRVLVEVMPLMGGVEDNSDPALGLAKTTLVVRGTVFMGGVEIKTRSRGTAVAE